jgi:hypothetical protein
LVWIEGLSSASILPNQRGFLFIKNFDRAFWVRLFKGLPVEVWAEEKPEEGVAPEWLGPGV